MSDFEQESSSAIKTQGNRENKTADKDSMIISLQALQIACFIVTVGMCISSLCEECGEIVGFMTAIITIVLSWIKQARLPKAYAIVSTVIAGLLGIILLTQIG